MEKSPQFEGGDFLKEKYWNKEEFREVVGASALKNDLEEDPDFKIPKESQESIHEAKSKAVESLAHPSRIGDYLERIKNIAENKGELFREISLYPKFVIEPENISDDYIKIILLGNFAEMKGYERDKLKMPEIREQIVKMFEAETNTDFETYQVPQEQKDQLAEQIVKDQKASLDRWFEYLTGPEAQNYPDAFKYWAFAEMLKLGAQDRDRKDFNKRVKETTAPFPELNQQALALVLDEMRRKYEAEPSRLNFGDKTKEREFQKRLEGENFGKFYGWALDYVNSLKLPEERLVITQGEWKKFARNSDHKALVDSIAGFNTGWCIAGEGTAESYLGHSDVWVYFSQDAEGQNSIPRAAVVTDGSRITEVRGIIQTKEVKQHLDDYITR